jgi:hypothetical protein
VLVRERVPGAASSFRQHQDEEEGVDVVVLNLLALPGFPPVEVDSDDDSGSVIAAGVADPTGPPF